MLLRHLAAYAELASLDFARRQRELTSQGIALAVCIICVLFALFLGCLAVIAYTWDTPYRLAAIGAMGGGFLLIAIGAALYAFNVESAKQPLFRAIRDEWHEDRVLLEHLLSAEED